MNNLSYLDGSLDSTQLRPPTRGERPAFVGFVHDADSMHAIRAAFAPAFPAGLLLHQFSFAETIEFLAGIDTPETILVDISGEDQPLTAVHQLETVVDPGTRVLIVGDQRSVSFYRSLIRTLGVREYLCKPLDAALVARELLPWATGTAPAVEPVRGGSMVAICGAAGGVGATTIATNLAWLIGGETHRHTILLDADMQRGSAALAANVAPTTGLRNALEAPDRIDPLLIERAAHPSVGRLHVLAAEEPLTESWDYRIGGARALSAALRQRYNFVIADIPARPFGFAAEILSLAQARIIVTTAAPQSLAHARRWIGLQPGAAQTMRPLVLLNRFQRRRGMSLARIVDALGTEISVVVPDGGAAMARAADLGEPPIGRKGRFRNAILELAGLIGAGATTGVA